MKLNFKDLYKQSNVDIIDKSKCSGCTACYSGCPIKCIQMKEDEEGFKYPFVDLKKCIFCGKCVKLCPFINENPSKNVLNVYGCQSKNKTILMQSASGGFFSILAEYIISIGGVVYGVIYNKDFKVIHERFDNSKEIFKLRSSKYSQSEKSDIYEKVKSDLDNSNKTLFSGTPCEIAGLKRYLGDENENLILVEVLCYGVPSPKIFRKYLEYLEKKENSKIIKINFRSKDVGITSLKIEFENGFIYKKNSSEDFYYNSFFSCINMRPSCYDCKSNNHRSGADMTLGDYWGCSTKFEMWDENKEGVSLVIVRTSKGADYFELLKDKIDYKETSLEHAIINNKSIVESCKKNPLRDNFFKKFEIIMTL